MVILRHFETKDVLTLEIEGSQWQSAFPASLGCAAALGVTLMAIATVKHVTDCLMPPVAVERHGATSGHRAPACLLCFGWPHFPEFPVSLKRDLGCKGDAFVELISFTVLKTLAGGLSAGIID